MATTMRRVWEVLVALALSACSAGSLTGTYIGHSKTSIDFLQLTDSNGQLLGSLSVAELQANGGIKATPLNVSGVADGDHLTLVIKSTELLSQPMNAGGVVAHGGIDLSFNGGTEHFAPATAQDYQASVATVAAQGQARQQQQAQAEQRAKAIKQVAELTHDLNAYADWIDAHPEGYKLVRDHEQKILDAARHDLALKHDLDAKHQDFPAGQASFRIGQLAFQMNQQRMQVDQGVQQGHEYLHDFDARLAANPCNAIPGINGCSALQAAQQRYAGVRLRVVHSVNQAAADIKQSEAEMTAINKDAGN